MIKIRAAHADDAQAIADLMNPTITTTTATFTTIKKTADGIAADIKAHARQNQPFLVAEGGTISGVASCAPFRAGPGYAHTMEHSIYVAPDAMGCGTAQALMNALEVHAMSQGITTLIGGISGENPRALAFHVKQGFVQTGRLPGVGHKFGRNLDLILMQKTLVSPDQNRP